MSAPATQTGTGKAAFLAAAFPAVGTPKLMLLDDTFTIAETHDFETDLSGEIAAGGGYTTGGITLSGLTAAYDSVTDEVTVEWDAISGLSVNACYAVLVVDTGSSATTPVLAEWDLSEGVGSDVPVTALSAIVYRDNVTP